MKIRKIADRLKRAAKQVVNYVRLGKALRKLPEEELGTLELALNEAEKTGKVP